MSQRCEPCFGMLSKAGCSCHHCSLKGVVAGLCCQALAAGAGPLLSCGAPERYEMLSLSAGRVEGDEKGNV